MKFHQKVCMLALSVLISPLASVAQEKPFVNPERPKDAKALNLLFFGNSFTLGGAGYYAYRIGGVARMVREVAFAHGYKAPNTQLTASNGVLLQFHYENNMWAISGTDKKPEGFEYPGGPRFLRFMGEQEEPTGEEFPAGFQWDYVTTCENDIGFVGGEERLKSSLEFSVKISEEVRKHSPNAKFIIYEPWARQVTLWNQSPIRQQELAANAAWRVANNLNDKWEGSTALSPAGEAWYRMGFPYHLYAHDRFHAESVGYFMNALVIYRTIYGGFVDADKLVAMSQKFTLGSEVLKEIVAAANAVEITPFGKVDFSAEAKDYPHAIFQADRYRQSLDYKTALASYEKALAFASDDNEKARAIRGIGDCQTGMKEFDKAREFYASILNLANVSTENKVLASNSIGISFVEQGNLGEAAKAFESTLAIPNLNMIDFYDTIFSATEFYKKSGNYAKMVELGKKTLVRPGLPSYFYVIPIDDIANYYISERRIDDAIKIYSAYGDIVTSKNNNPGHYFGLLENRARLLIQQGKYVEAAQGFERWVKEYPEHAEPMNGGKGRGMLRQAEILTLGGKYAEAEKLYNEVLKQDKKEVLKNFFDAGVAADPGDAIRSKELLQNQFASAYIGMAKIYCCTGRLNEAFAFDAKIDAIDELSADSKAAHRNELVNVLTYHIGRLGKESILQRTDISDPMRARLLFELANVSTKSYENLAQKYYADILLLKGISDGERLRAFNQSGTLYLSSGQLEKALEQFLSASKLNIPAHEQDRLGQSVKSIGDYYRDRMRREDLSRKFFINFLATDTQINKAPAMQSFVWYMDSLLRQKAPEKAVDALQSVYKTGKGFAGRASDDLARFVMRLSQYYAGQKDNENAIQVYGDAIKNLKMSENIKNQMEKNVENLNKK